MCVCWEHGQHGRNTKHMWPTQLTCNSHIITKQKKASTLHLSFQSAFLCPTWKAAHWECTCACVCSVRDDPPCPSGSVVRWWACRLLCQRLCPAGTRRWGVAPTLASHPPWFTSSQRDQTSGTERGRNARNLHKACMWLKKNIEIRVHGFACKL